MDLVRHLGSQFMKRQCRDQADHAVRNTLGHGGQIGIRQGREIRQTVDPPRKSLNLATIPHRVKRARMDPGGYGFGGTQNSTIGLERFTGAVDQSGHRVTVG